MAPKRRKRHLKKQQQTIKMTSTFVWVQTRHSCTTWSERVMWTRDPLRIPLRKHKTTGTEPRCCLLTDLHGIWIWEMESKTLKQMQTGLGRSKAVFTVPKANHTDCYWCKRLFFALPIIYTQTMNWWIRIYKLKSSTRTETKSLSNYSNFSSFE